MELTFLGTGAGVPSKARNVSCTLLKLLDERNEMWMFDCGEGSQQQFLKTTLKPRKVTKIFISHVHGDHMYGLPGFLSSRSFQGGENVPLTIYGPKGVKKYVQTSLGISKTRLTYPIYYQELDQSGIAFKDQQFTVKYATLDHIVPSYGFRVEEADSAGELLIDKAREAGVPNGPLLGQLKAGLTIQLEDGRELQGKDFLGPDKRGKIVSIYGDTRYCQAGIDLAQNADVLVHEATFEAGEEKMAHDYYHSTASQAALVAKKAGVKQLYLTHISARYVGAMAKELQKGAEKIFPASQVVKDFDSYAIK
ncbi:ribonuclease Z [Aerococcus tenax]|uniref:ribonuclease Z n=1 Tax=Aerococcus tenax TaxID=3078812 RepID=UPI0018A7DE4B|nr:ribonuclease Z [Aerococcus tenax]